LKKFKELSWSVRTQTFRGEQDACRKGGGRTTLTRAAEKKKKEVGYAHVKKKRQDDR